MSDVEHFALLVLVVGAAIIAAVLLNRVSERIRIPAPAIFLVAAALASDVMPALGELSVTTVQRVVSVALAVILFDGGMHMGWQRFRSAAGPVVWVGVAGTFVTAAALAILAHGMFGLDWRSALLVGTALAPTDPAVVFSVLGRREIAGRSGTILEGEAGANDPVGIALLASLLTAGPAMGLGAVGSIAGAFLLQLTTPIARSRSLLRQGHASHDSVPPRTAPPALAITDEASPPALLSSQTIFRGEESSAPRRGLAGGATEQLPGSARGSLALAGGLTPSRHGLPSAAGAVHRNTLGVPASGRSAWWAPEVRMPAVPSSPCPRPRPAFGVQCPGRASSVHTCLSTRPVSGAGV
jgi:hypothetical protein